MKFIQKTVFSAIAAILAASSAFAVQIEKIDRLIKTSELNNTAVIAVSIKNAESGSTVYGINEKKLLHPASSLKIFTAYAALDTLGYDYEFKTRFYKSGSDLYIKLGADPLLTSDQLKNALKELAASGYNSFDNLYIDDSVLDKKEFAPGWMYEDDISPYTPKVSSYNLDGNVIKADLIPLKDGIMSIRLKSKFPMSVISCIKTDEGIDRLDMERYNWNNPDVVEINGLVNKTTSFKIPLSSTRRYFIYNTDNALEEAGIDIKLSKYASVLVPEDSQLLIEISNPVSGVLKSILQNSSNLPAETIYKLAASEKYGATGTDELAGFMFKDYYKRLGADTESIIIKDGCGVSRYNLFSAGWMTDALSKIYKTKNYEKFKENMAQTGDGTLSDRLFELRGDAVLKTGSLSNVSAIAGWIKSQDGRVYSAAILIQNFNQKQAQIKHFEDEIIKLIFYK